MGRKKTTRSVFQAHLPFRAAISGRTDVVSLVLEKRILFILSGALIMLAFLYSYFVMMSVAHVAMRQDLEHESEKLSGIVARLEREYLAAASGLTEDSARAEGLARGARQTFVERLGSNVALSLVR